MVFIKPDKVMAILVSALEQSNSCFLPKVYFLDDLKEIDCTDYASKFYFDLSGKSLNRSMAINQNSSQKIFAIGPEGGLSHKERDYFDHFKLLQSSSPLSNSYCACGHLCSSGLYKNYRMIYT